MTTIAAAPSGVRVEPVSHDDDVVEGFECTAATFGRQTNDGGWTSNHPGWDTPEGKQKGADRMIARWRGATKNKDGQPNTVFLKATVPDPANEGGRLVAGFAIWLQASVVPGHGDAPPEDLGTVIDLESIYPGQPREQLFLRQFDYGLHRQRLELVKKKAETGASPPAVMVLDCCVVKPEYQGRGIARQLVQWGLDEAERRGGLEAVTEASPMGRGVYAKMGFQQEGPEIDYGVDAEFKDRLPSNIFMRTCPE